MGFRYYRRINLGGGTGLNVSGSGISPSYRTKYGSIGPKGFSLRTGIPGLSYRSGKSGNAIIIILVVAALAGTFVIAWNLLRFVVWFLQETYHAIQRRRAASLTFTPQNALGSSSTTTLNSNIIPTQLSLHFFKSYAGRAVARNIAFVSVALVAAALLLSPNEKPSIPVSSAQKTPYVPVANNSQSFLPSEPQQNNIPATTTSVPVPLPDQENAQAQNITDGTNITSSQTSNLSDDGKSNPSPENMPLSLLNADTSNDTTQLSEAMPLSLNALVPSYQWGNVRHILLAGFDLGEKKEIVQWGEDHGVQGTVYQSGDGIDPQGCRQFRIEKINPVPTLFAYVDVCPNGQIK